MKIRYAIAITLVFAIVSGFIFIDPNRDWWVYIQPLPDDKPTAKFELTGWLRIASGLLTAGLYTIAIFLFHSLITWLTKVRS